MSVSNNNDPSSWTQVGSGGPVLTSNVGTTGVRDPSIIRSADGSKFWIIATDLWVHPEGWDVGDKYTTEGSHGIVVWESNDLKTWSEPALRIVSPENAGMTWAPDAIWDPSRGQCKDISQVLQRRGRGQAANAEMQTLSTGRPTSSVRDGTS